MLNFVQLTKWPSIMDALKYASTRFILLRVFFAICYSWKSFFQKCYIVPQISFHLSFHFFHYENVLERTMENSIGVIMTTALPCDVTQCFNLFGVVSKTQNILPPSQIVPNRFSRIGKSTSWQTEVGTSTPVHPVATPHLSQRHLITSSRGTDSHNPSTWMPQVSHFPVLIVSGFLLASAYWKPSSS